MGDMKKYVIKMWGMILKWLGTTALQRSSNRSRVFTGMRSLRAWSGAVGEGSCNS